MIRQIITLTILSTLSLSCLAQTKPCSQTKDWELLGQNANGCLYLGGPVHYDADKNKGQFQTLINYPRLNKTGRKPAWSETQIVDVDCNTYELYFNQITYWSKKNGQGVVTATFWDNVDTQPVKPRKDKSSKLWRHVLRACNKPIE